MIKLLILFFNIRIFFITKQEKYGNILNYYTERLQKNLENKETKICVIGHTHHPYINTDINDGKNIYIDAGAWSAGRSDFVVITNEEVGICSYKR